MYDIAQNLIDKISYFIDFQILRILAHNFLWISVFHEYQMYSGYLAAINFKWYSLYILVKFKKTLRSYG